MYFNIKYLGGCNNDIISEYCLFGMIEMLESNMF